MPATFAFNDSAATASPPDTDAAWRGRRSLRRAIPLHTLAGVRDAQVSTHWLETEDRLGLSMLRFHRRPARDVVLVIHDLATSTDMFVQPERYNLVSYLLDNGFSDVWSLDFRMSSRHGYNRLPEPWSLDDCAVFDHPVAIARIREVVGPDAAIHVIGHGLGAMSFSMALFAKTVTGIRSCIANSVALTPCVPARSRSSLGTPSGEGGYRPFGALLSKGLRRFRRHDEHLGIGYRRHVEKMLDAGGRIVKMKPSDARYAALPEDYLACAGAVTTPVLLTTGAANRVFADSNVRCHEALRTRAPGRHELAVFPGYGHDVFTGKRAHSEVFPHLVDFLERHRVD